MFQCLASFPEENRYSLVDVHYKVVPSFPYNPRLNAAFVLLGAAYIFNLASICGVTEGCVYSSNYGIRVYDVF